MVCAYSSTYQIFQGYWQVPSGEITHFLSIPTNWNFF